MRKKSLPSYIFSITGVLLSKENFPFLIPFLSIPIFFETSFKFSKKDKIIWATTSILLSAIWFIMIQKVIHPYYTGGVAKNHVVSRFPGFGETNTEVIYNLLFVPKYWLKLLSERVLNLSTFKYLILLLAPYFVLIYRRWYWILASTPIIAMNVLSYANTQRMMIFHYELVILPLLIYPVLLTLKEYEWNNHKKKWKVALLVGVAFSGKWPAYYIWEYFPSKNEFQSIAFFKDIEDDGNNIATSMRLLAQITHIKHQKVIHYQSDLTLDKVINYEHNRNNRFNRLPITRILFDLSKPKEKLLYYEAKLEGWKEYKRAPATQFVILKREL